MFEPVYREIFPFWNEISPETRDTICQNSVAMTYLKGTTIHDGTECSGVFFIRSGCLRVYLLSEKGKDITLYRLYAGDMCMLSASCVLQSITFDVMIDAEEDSECYVISGPAFVSVSEANPKIKIFSLETAISRFSDVMWVMQQILFMSMDQRLAIFLSWTSRSGWVPTPSPSPTSRSPSIWAPPGGCDADAEILRQRGPCGGLPGRGENPG